MIVYATHSEVLEVLTVPVAVVDPNCIIRDANGAYCRRFGGKKPQIIGKRCHEICHDLSSPCWQHGYECPLKMALKTRQSTRVLHNHRNPKGAEVWEEVVTTPLFDSAGSLRCIVEELRDVGELLRMENVLEVLKQKVNILRGLVPMCANCNKIRDEDGSWRDVSAAIDSQPETTVTHGICPDCMKKLYPQFVDPPKKDHHKS